MPKFTIAFFLSIFLNEGGLIVKLLLSCGDVYNIVDVEKGFSYLRSLESRLLAV